MSRAIGLARRTHRPLMVSPSRLHRLLTWGEAVLARVYWSCLKARSDADDRLANREGFYR